MKKPKKLLHSFSYPSDIDKIMIPLLDAINSIPGCRTLYSCSGHGLEPFYVCIGVCNLILLDTLVDWFTINMDKSTEITTNYKDSPYGLLSYEKNLGIYSMKIGQLPEKKQISIINKLTKKIIDEFVPFSTWDSHI